jgi:hypothetical protein
VFRNWTFVQRSTALANLQLMKTAFTQVCAVCSPLCRSMGQRALWRVESRRRSNCSLPVVSRLGFRLVTSVRFGLVLFPVPARRTGLAVFPASGSRKRLTLSPTEGSWSGVATRLHRSYEPLRHPIPPGLSLASCQLIDTLVTAGASRVASGLLCVHAIAITPDRFNGACSLAYLHCQRPSPCNSKVGSCNCFFGACSAFTHVTACTFAESPSDPLHRELRQLCCLRCRLDCYRVERTSSRAGVAPAVVQRLSRRTVTSNGRLPMSKACDTLFCKRFFRRSPKVKNANFGAG